MSTSLGNQWMMEIYDCDPHQLERTNTVEDVLVEAARLCKATVISSEFHQFQPHGVSGVVIISESHLAIHTWPERGYAAVDVFTCGVHLRADVAADYIARQFGAKHYQVFELERGRFDENNQPQMSRPVITESVRPVRMVSPFPGPAAVKALS